LVEGKADVLFVPTTKQKGFILAILAAAALFQVPEKVEYALKSIIVRKEIWS
jgi:hypothetical protein